MGGGIGTADGERRRVEGGAEDGENNASDRLPGTPTADGGIQVADRLRGSSAVGLILAVVLLLLSLSYALHTARLAPRLPDNFGVFTGAAALALPLCGTLWRRFCARTPPPPRPRKEWLADLARAERERVQDDLRFRGVEVAPVAVPWQAAPEMGGLSAHGDADDAPRAGGVGRLEEAWSGRLVVTGAVGSGKSIALELLARHLLLAGGAVPVVLSLAGWEPRLPLHTWVARQLTERYPGLLGEVPGDDLLRALRRDGAVVPFLDGFDEVAKDHRVPLLRALDQALGAHLPVALASRTEQFREAVAIAGPVRNSVAIRLTPLTPDHFAAFLTDSRPPNLPAWQPLLASMRTGGAPAATEAFTTPLMQWLGLRVYGRRPEAQHPPGQQLLESPLRLADRSRFPTALSIERHLLAALVPATLNPRSTRTAGQHPRRWLNFLARHTQRHGGGTGGAIRWWHLHRGAQPQLATVYGLLFTALAAGLARCSHPAATGLLAGALWGTACGAAATWAHALARRTEYRARSTTPGGGFRSTAFGRTVLFRLARLLPLIGVAAAVTLTTSGLLFAPLDGSDLRALLLQGLTLALLTGVSGGFTAGTVLNRAGTLDATVAPAKAGRPHELLRRDARTSAAVAVCFAVAGAVSARTAWSLTLDGTEVTPPPTFLLPATAMFALLATCVFTAWPIFRAAHAWYVLRDQLPLRYGAFITRAHETGILREDGVAHRFRHGLLQLSLETQSRAPR